ncbi:rab9 effector protein with kelch motifs-like [Lineus longissimus]|uniref:rab9 effector protein with kelch motifs-like n=1 Tax=Lineus longissimus TaxID=88925 RepID=UPI002B4E4872
MEVHPFLEQGVVPNNNLWYVLSTLGESPTMRVGHSCSFIPGENGNGKLFVIGGATPSGSFSEVFLLDLDTLQWDTCEAEGFKGRYEHAAFVPESVPQKVYIFGGAEQSGNMKSVQVYDMKDRTWTSVDVTGTAPSARTQHMSQAGCGDKFYVFSGGESGVTPVNDRNVYCFDTSTHSWSTLETHGKTPEPRHGHLFVGVGTKLYLHGGMSGPNFFDDVHVFDLMTNTWHNEKKRKGFLSARAAHSGVAVGKFIYVFGGMNKEGALDDTYRLNTETLKWTRIDLGGPPPTSRLDFAMCAFPFTINVSGDAETSNAGAAAKRAQDAMAKSLQVLSLGEDPEKEGIPEGAEPSKETRDEEETEVTEQAAGDAVSASASIGTVTETQTVTLVLLHGGMDTEGNIWDDSLVFKAE